MVYYAACYEPGLVDRALKREPGPTAMSPYGDFDLVLGTLIDRLTASPYLTGDTATAADVLWAWRSIGAPCSASCRPIRSSPTTSPA
ncbi:MAG: hypothetical protein WDN69_31245 [Aliidongia sp.]